VARILIVGGGCRGRRVASQLVEGGHSVRITTRSEVGRAVVCAPISMKRSAVRPRCTPMHNRASSPESDSGAIEKRISTARSRSSPR